jgi:hypothetical protein
MARVQHGGHMPRAMRTAILLLAAIGTTLPLPAARAQEPAPPSAEPTLTLEQRMKLRCSAAFALIADRQARGDEAALRYPPLAARGREFFVRSAAAVMDEGGLDRAAINAAITREALDIVAAGTLDEVMPACLQALAGSGL